MGDDISTAKQASTATFVTALVFNAAVFGVEIVAFTIVRPYFKAIYEPRTYVPPPSKRAQPLSASILKWPWAVYNADYRNIIKANGMDAYFFVRFLRMMAKVLLPMWFISWAVLLPLTSVNTSVNNSTGLDRFTFGNISPNRQTRYAAHLILVYFFTFWIFYNIKQEMRHFVITRQKYLMDPVHAKSTQANTLLITGIPAKYLTQEALLKMFNELPGGVKKITLNRNLKELPDIYDRRLSACAKLESAETSLLKTAAKLRLEALKQKGGKKGATVKSAASNGKNEPLASDPEVGTDEDFVPTVPKDKRPQHRLGSIPFFGKKVDTIEWAREEIRVCNELLAAGRNALDGHTGEGLATEDEGEDGAPSEERKSSSSGDDHGGKLKQIGGKVKAVVGKGKGKQETYPVLNSAFVTFNKQIAAHLGAQALAHHEPYRMSGRYLEVAPEDVIWSNLGLNPYEMKVRMLISYALTAGLIILWAFPVAFIGVISNVHALCTEVKWLAWICDLPDVVIGIISGILPPVLLAVLMMLLPIVLRLLARFEGIPKRTGLELSLMSRFFIFQVIHSFLIVSLSSGIIAALPGLLENPGSVSTLLAQNLPLASNFFLTYVILQGLSVTAGSFLQAVPLVIYYVKLFILGSTPRSIYGIKYGAKSVAWGTTFPGITLLVVIALGYSIISPIINGLACATFFMFYQLYKYQFLWQFEQNRASDTGGLFFPKAIQHIFVGLYVQQVVLCALFFLARNEFLKASAVPQGILMIVLIVITAFFNMMINNSYGPLLHALPLSLADKTYSAPAQEVAASEDGHGPDNGPATGSGTTTATGTGALLPAGTSRGEPRRRSTAMSEENDIRRYHTPAGSEHDHGELDENGAPVQETESTKAPPSVKVVSQASEEEEYGFEHPAASRPQRTVWIPKDVLGLGEEEERACLEVGVDASLKDASMDAAGKVDISGGPPDLRVED